MNPGLLTAHPFDIEGAKARLAAANGGYEIVHESPGLEIDVYVLVAPEPDRQAAHDYIRQVVRPLDQQAPPRQTAFDRRLIVDVNDLLRVGAVAGPPPAEGQPIPARCTAPAPRCRYGPYCARAAVWAPRPSPGCLSRTAGAIAAVSTIVPDLSVALWDACQRGDHATARNLHERIQPVWTAVNAPDMSARVKAAIELRGRRVGPARCPLLPVSAATRRELAAAPDQAGILPVGAVV